MMKYGNVKKRGAILPLMVIFSVFISICVFAAREMKSPVRIPVFLSATLGEIRGNALHQGIDIKTNGRIGYPVYPAYPGTLFRFISKEFGYGNALFFNHDDGRQTVYGHLDCFEDEGNSLNTLSDTIKVLYNSDVVDFTFYNAGFKYKENAVIAYTGESGSGQPHLHFEVREGDRYLNPQQYVRIADNIPPVIEAVYLCAERDNATVSERKIQVKKGWGKYYTAESVLTAGAGDKLFLKIMCYDQIGAVNRVAVFSMRLMDGGKQIFERTFDSFNKDDVDNGYFVYDVSKSMIRDGVSYAYFLCNRKGSPFKNPKGSGDGYIDLKDGEKNLKIEVADFAGNISSLALKLVPQEINGKPDNFISVKKGKRCLLNNKGNDVTVEILPESLSRDALLRLDEPADSGICGMIQQSAGIAGKDILKIISMLPSDSVYSGYIRVAMKKPDWLRKENAGQVLIFRCFEGRKPVPLETKYYPESGIFEAYTNTNGYYALINDRVPPRIFLPPVQEFSVDRGFRRRLRFHAVDNVSRIRADSIICIIDGESFPFRFDIDRDWIEVSLLKETIVGGTHHVFLSVKDNAGNRTVFRDLFMFN